jgi:monofunctional biosynthetic peptidoglycan transglycosylase
MTRRFKSKLLWVAGVAGALALTVAGTVVYVIATLPDVSNLTGDNPSVTALMRERGGERTQDWVALADIEPLLVRAVLMGEDAGFYGHNGFDTHEIKAAFKRNWERGRTVSGASTITQQLAKNLYLSSERTYSRKLKEALLTYRLEKTLSKSRILEIYLNVIEWGDGVYGAQAAARDVFGKSAKWLSAAEAATLAAMIPSPKRLNPCEQPDSVRVRRDRILTWMHGAGDLTDAELQQAINSTPALRKC